MRVRACVCARACALARARVCVCVCVCARAHAHTHSHTHARAHTRIRTRARTHTRARAHTHVRACGRVCVSVCVCKYRSITVSQIPLVHMYINPFPKDKFDTLPNWETLQMTISNLMKWLKVFQIGRKHCGKRRNYSWRAISSFHTVFSKDLYWGKTGLVLERVKH